MVISMVLTGNRPLLVGGDGYGEYGYDDVCSYVNGE